MIETTLSQLRQLKLTGMASALQSQQDQPGTYEWKTASKFCHFDNKRAFQFFSS